MNYTFGEHVRWSGPWESPNVFGIVLVLLLSAAWFGWRWGSSYPKTRYAMILAEGGVMFALCKTYSRGALMAAVAAAGFCGVRWLRSGEARCTRDLMKAVVWRAGGLLVCLMITGFGSRIEPAYLLADDSVLHRGQIWSGALRMLAHNELRGWGWNEGASAYLQWFQPYQDKLNVGNLVSGDLQFIVEGGLISTFVATAVIVLFLNQALLTRAETIRHSGLCWAEIRADLPALGGCWLIALLVGNAFSGLATSPIVSAAGVVALLFCAMSGRALLQPRALIGAAALAAVTTIGIAVAARVASRHDTLTIVHCANGVVEICRRSEGPIIRADIYPDPAILGARFGKPLRQAAEAMNQPAVLRVHICASLCSDDAGAGLILFGRMAEVGQAYPTKKKILVHPRVARAYPKLDNIVLTVVPEMDSLGEERFWCSMAGDHAGLWRSPERDQGGWGLPPSRLAEIFAFSRS